MARQYTFSKLPGASGSFAVLDANGDQMQPGVPLPPGSTFDLKYFVSVRLPDQYGITYEARLIIDLQDVSIGQSNADIVAKVQAERKLLIAANTATAAVKGGYLV